MLSGEPTDTVIKDCFWFPSGLRRMLLSVGGLLTGVISSPSDVLCIPVMTASPLEMTLSVLS
jgi:hypothetical protein